MRRMAVACLAGSGLLVVGCGPPSASTAAQARDAVRVFLTACAEDKPQAAAEVLTEPSRTAFLRARSPTAGCLAATNLNLGAVGDAAARRALHDAQVTVTHVHGIYAVARIAAPGGARGGTQLDDVGGDWQLAGGID